MLTVKLNTEILNDILIINVTEKVIPLKGVLNLLKDSRCFLGVILNNKVADYIPDQYSISYLLDLITAGLPSEQRKLAIIPFTSLQKAMFEIVFDDFKDLNISVNYFKEVNPALSWIRLPHN